MTRLTPFTDLVPPLQFPIGGQTFEGYGPSIGDWQLIERIEAGTATPEETEGVDLYRLALGELYGEMLAANVPYRAMQHAALACAAFARSGRRDVAEAVWIHGTDQAGITAALSASQEPAPAPVKAASPAKPRTRKTAAR